MLTLSLSLDEMSEFLMTRGYVVKKITRQYHENDGFSTHDDVVTRLAYVVYDQFNDEILCSDENNYMRKISVLQNLASKEFKQLLTIDLPKLLSSPRK